MDLSAEKLKRLRQFAELDDDYAYDINDINMCKQMAQDSLLDLTGGDGVGLVFGITDAGLAALASI